MASIAKRLGKWLTNHYDDIGTVVGFVGGSLIGQPALGAAIGRSIGSQIGPEHKGEKGVGLAAREAATGYGMGALGAATGADEAIASKGFDLGVNTGATQAAKFAGLNQGIGRVASAPLPGVSPAALPAGPGVPIAPPPPPPASVAPGAAPQGGGILSRIGRFYSGPDALAHAYMTTQLLGTLGDLYSGYQQGRLADEDRKRLDRLAPLYGRLLTAAPGGV